MSVVTTSNTVLNNTPISNTLSAKVAYTTTPATTGTQLNIPAGTLYVTAKIWGAGGGTFGGTSGAGGYTTITFVPTSNAYWISVGRPGQYASSSGGSIMPGGTSTITGLSSVSAGDASVLTQFSGSTYTLIAVAGGGGAGGNGSGGGAGGGTSGQNGTNSNGGSNGTGGSNGSGTGSNAILTASSMTGFGGTGGFFLDYAPGGGGYGGGGAGNSGGNITNGAGGAGYISSSTTLTTILSSSTTAGNLTVAPNTSDNDYISGKAIGVSTGLTTGGAGYIVIIYNIYNAITMGVSSFTDRTTLTSGTVSLFTNVNIPQMRLSASNTSITTTNASSLLIQGSPVAGTNETITNSYALNVASGSSTFSSAGGSSATTSTIYINPTSTTLGTNTFFTYLTAPTTTGSGTTASTLYIAGAPSGGSITNSYALNIATGNTLMNGFFNFLTANGVNGAPVSSATNYMSLNNNPIFLRGINGSDKNHYLAFNGTTGSSYSSFTIDGPILAGFAGGILGATNGGNTYSFKWDNNGNCQYRGTLTQNTSDIRLKNITHILNPDDSLQKIKNINSYIYILKEDQHELSPKKQYGYLAQEIESLCPELTLKHSYNMPAGNICEYFSYTLINNELIFDIGQYVKICKINQNILISGKLNYDVKGVITQINDTQIKVQLNNGIDLSKLCKSNNKIYVYGVEQDYTITVDYMKVTTLCSSAIQALSNNIDNLEKENIQLKQSNIELYRLIDNLQQQIFEIKASLNGS